MVYFLKMAHNFNSARDGEVLYSVLYEISVVAVFYGLIKFTIRMHFDAVKRKNFLLKSLYTNTIQVKHEIKVM